MYWQICGNIWHPYPLACMCVVGTHTWKGTQTQAHILTSCWWVSVCCRRILDCTLLECYCRELGRRRRISRHFDLRVPLLLCRKGEQKNLYMYISSHWCTTTSLFSQYWLNSSLKPIEFTETMCCSPFSLENVKIIRLLWVCCLISLFNDFFSNKLWI